MNAANEYQELAARTLLRSPDGSYSDHELMLVWCAMGLGGEAGEILDKLKKLVFHKHGVVTHADLELELGDLLWYIAGICTLLGIKLSDVMLRNIDKLRKRYPDGYSSERSINRIVENHE